MARSIDASTSRSQPSDAIYADLCALVGMLMADSIHSSCTSKITVTAATSAGSVWEGLYIASGRFRAEIQSHPRHWPRNSLFDTVFDPFHVILSPLASTSHNGVASRHFRAEQPMLPSDLQLAITSQ
ncbi:hypothetical protein HaLaN_18467, partial [Haematococcus lacustris]